MLCFSLVHVIPGYGERLCWTDSVNTYTFKVTGARAGYVSKSVRTHHSALLNSKEFLCRSKYRINSGKMQLYRPLFQNVFCNSKSFQISSECNIYHSCFHFFLCSSKSFEIPPECTMFRPYFSFCSFKNRQNAQFTVLVFKCFSAVRNRRLSRNPRSVPDRYKLDVHDRP